MRIKPLFLAVLVVAAIAPLRAWGAPFLSGATSAPRRHDLMDASWRFQLASQSTLSKAIPIAAWRWTDKNTSGDVPILGADWRASKTGDDTFGGRVGAAWFRATLPALAGANRVLRFESVDDNATVYLNNRKLISHQGWNESFDVALDKAWKTDAPNELAMLVENTAGAGGISGDVTLGIGAKASQSDPWRADFDDTKWRVVHLPHDYVVEGQFTPKGDTSHGSLIPKSAWYRKTFALPASDRGKTLWLDFDGVYRGSEIYLNGQKLGEHACGYTPFQIDISRAARFGKPNVLAVRVNPQHFEGWWYEGGGIYRHVWLNVANPVHVVPRGTFVSAQMPEPQPGKPVPPAVLTVKTTIDFPLFRVTNSKHSSKFFGYYLVSQIIAPSNEIVSEYSVGGPRPPRQKEFVQKITVGAPQLWSIEKPQMYRLHTEVRQEGKVLDATDTPFGIRTIRFDAERGFFLNGVSVKIKGTCNHQDFAGVGVAMPDSLLFWRIKKLKEMGSNAYRTAHNPPTRELLDACDQLGMLVMDENRHLGDTENGKASLDTPYADLHEVESMVLRDRNHPSIIMWSMCNEENIQGSSHGARIFRAMKKAVDKHDGTRPVTCAMNYGYADGDREGITSVTDLQGINYGPGNYDWFHKAHPNLPLYGSETSSAVTTRGIYDTTRFKRDGVQYWGDELASYVSAYDVNAPSWAQTAQAAWQPIADRPFVAGGFVWTGFDYKGETTPYGWPCVNSHFGIMDMCGFPKDNYFYYQSVWRDKPIVHLLPHWNWRGRDGQPITVWAYSNAARVELLLNGKSLGTKDMPRNGHLEWEVPFAPGRLEARGTDANGKSFATDAIETTGAPVALKLSTDRATLQADGEDLAMVEVDVVDAQGRIVPTANDEASFSIRGAAHVAGVGNGDPTSHESDKAHRRHAFNGKCMVIVGANEKPGRIHLVASAPGLKSAVLDLQAIPPATSHLAVP